MSLMSLVHCSLAAFSFFCSLVEISKKAWLSVGHGRVLYFHLHALSDPAMISGNKYLKRSIA